MYKACSKYNFVLAFSCNNMDILIDQYILVLLHSSFHGYFVLLYCDFFYKFPTHKHLGCFLYFTITNNAAMNILKYLLLLQ